MTVKASSLGVVATMIFFVMHLIGCGGNHTPFNMPAKGPEMVGEEKRLRIISEEKEFQLYNIADAKEGEAGYIVKIFDDEKKVIYQEQLPKKAAYIPRVKVVNDDLILIRLYENGRVGLTRYYDRKTNRVSPAYKNELFSGYGKVVFFNHGKIIVTGRFDENIFYKEFAIEDLPELANPADAFLEIIWTGPDGLLVTYAVKRGELFTDKTVFFDLTSAATKGREASRTAISHQLVHESKEYQLLKGPNPATGRTEYVVVIFDDNGNIVHVSSYPVSPKAPSVRMLDNDIVALTLGVGTGLNYTHYFDRKNGRKSPVYITPLLIGYGKVVAPKRGKLIVSDMFDEGLYYKELIIDDFPPVANPVDAFAEMRWAGANKLSVTHLAGKKGEKYSTKTVVFDLSD